MSEPTIGSLCSGYGGLDLGVMAALPGVRVAWHAENDPDAARVLDARWPGVPNHGDLTAFDWHRAEPVDVITAGWPCQPWSLAGKRRGADDERAIWPAVAHAIRTVRPRVAFLENVPAVIALGELERAVADLAAAGYVGSWRCVRASDVGAPHRRERTFIAARLADAEGLGHGHAGTQGGQRVPAAAVAGGAHGMLPTPAARLGRATSITPGTAARRLTLGKSNLDDWAALLPTPRASDGDKGGPNQRDSHGNPALSAVVQPGRWGRYGEAITRWEQILGRPAPEPTEASPSSGVRLAPVFVEWLMGLPAGWVTDLTGRNAAMARKPRPVTPLGIQVTIRHAGRVA